MKFWKELMEKKWAPYTIATCSAVVLYLALTHVYYLFDALHVIYMFATPVVMGLIIAYVMNPFVEFIQKHVFKKIAHRKNLSRNLAVITAIFVVLLLVILLMVALIPQLVSSSVTFQKNFAGYATSFREWFASMIESKKGIGIILGSISFSWDVALDHITKVLSNYLGDAENVSSIIDTSFSVGKSFANVLIACILAIYFMIDMPRLVEAGKQLLKVLTGPKKYYDVTGFIKRCNHILCRFIVCDVIEGIIVGLVNFVFMAIMGMDYAVLISVVVGVTNMVPTFGPIVGCLIGMFILLLVHPIWSIWFLIFTILLQTVDGYIIKPKLYGDTLGVSPLLILIAIVVGGRMFGVIGILLAIPVSAILDYIFREILWQKLLAWKGNSSAE